jgi:hypothetical protein
MALSEIDLHRIHLWARERTGANGAHRGARRSASNIAVTIYSTSSCSVSPAACLRCC